MSLLLGTLGPFSCNSAERGFGGAVGSNVNRFTLKLGAGVGKQINLI